VSIAATIASCNHGTQVAGIAAGTSSDFSGVARGSSIISVQVFTEFSATHPDLHMEPHAPEFQDGSAQALSVCIIAWFLQYRCGEQASVTTNVQPSDLRQLEWVTESRDRQPPFGQHHNGDLIETTDTRMPTAPACGASAVSVGNTTKSDAVRLRGIEHHPAPHGAGHLCQFIVAG
jgi:hypothetical protein